MKGNKIILFALAALMAAAISSCKKDVLETSELPVTGPYGSLQDFYDQHGAGITYFTINPDLLNVITGPQGTQIQVLANSLRDSNGLPPAGDLTVTLREIYDTKTMVLSHTPTTSDGNILQSGGMIYLEFSANNIRYAPVTYIKVTMPSDNIVSGMKVFLGESDQNTGINWALPDSGMYVLIDSAVTSYVLYVDSLGYGWINCDKFYQAGTPTNITIGAQVSAERNETVDLAVYLLFPSINSVMSVYNMSGPQSVVAYNIPVGMQAVAAVVGVGRITGKSYFGKTNIRVVASQNISVSVTQMSGQQIMESLSNL